MPSHYLIQRAVHDIHFERPVQPKRQVDVVPRASRNQLFEKPEPFLTKRKRRWLRSTSARNKCVGCRKVFGMDTLGRRPTVREGPRELFRSLTGPEVRRHSTHLANAAVRASG